MRYNKLAFTLAEVLITLGIVGVISALTIPNLVARYQKVFTVSRLKVIYSQLSQAIKLSVVQNEDMSGWNFGNRTGASFFEEYIMPYIKGVSKVALKKTNTKYKQSSGKQETGLALLRDLNTANIYTTLNGTQLFFGTVTKTSANAQSIGFIVDINGFSPPNQFGKDVFYFVLSVEHGLYPMGTYSGGEYTFVAEPNNDRNILLGKKKPKSCSVCDYGCSKSARGMWCGALIMLDGWEIRSDYPW